MKHSSAWMVVAALGLSGCFGVDSMSEVPPGDDSKTDDLGGGPGGFADASVPVADAAPEPDAETKPDAMPEEPQLPDTATVNVDLAECLFMLSGPGPTYERLLCVEEEAPWCNFLGQVCLDYGVEVKILGEPEIYTGSELADACPENNWYPVSYRDYEGYSCGAYLDFGGATP